MTVELTAEAQRMLDEYLRQADAYLRGAPATDAEEVERDLREHVARELQNASQPVSAADMEAVLQRLGAPEQLVPEEELSWWQRTARHWRTGPQDWRLAYISLGVLLLAPLVGPLAILASFLVARAALESAGEGRELGPQRWFLYPGLILVYIPLAALLLFWPIAGVVPELVWQLSWKPGMVISSSPNPALSNPPVLLTPHSPLPVMISLLLLPIWWLVLTAIVRRNPRFLPALFRPFLRASGIEIVTRLLIYGFLLFCVWLAFVLASRCTA